MPKVKAGTLVTDRPANSKIYNDLLRILHSLTGVQWGYVKNKHRVQYLSSVEVPLKIGIEWGKGYEKNVKYKLDISISNKSPAIFGDQTEWENAVKTELHFGLLELVKNEEIKNKISQWEPEGEYAEMLIFAAEQNKKYSYKGLEIAEQREYDLWLNNCMQE